MAFLDICLDRESIAAVYANLLPPQEASGAAGTDLFYSEVLPFYTPDLLGIAVDPEILDDRARAPMAVADYLLCCEEIDVDTHQLLCQALGDLGQQQTVLKTRDIMVDAAVAANEVAQGLVAQEIINKRRKGEGAWAA